MAIAQVEMAKYPAIALDLLAFHVASKMIVTHPVIDGPLVDQSDNLPRAL